MLRNNASYHRQRIDIGVRTYNSTGIQYTVTANLNIITEHCTELTKTCLISSALALNNYILPVSLDVGSDGTCTEVSLISEN